MERVKVDNCAQANGDRCEMCEEGYFVLNGVCSRANPLCDRYQMIGGGCLSCIAGYSLFQSNCVKNNPPTTVRDINCLEIELNRCVRCSNRYYIDENGRCIVVNPLCRDHDDRGNCT